MQISLFLPVTNQAKGNSICIKTLQHRQFAQQVEKVHQRSTKGCMGWQCCSTGSCWHVEYQHQNLQHHHTRLGTQSHTKEQHKHTHHFHWTHWRTTLRVTETGRQKWPSGFPKYSRWCQTSIRRCRGFYCLRQGKQNAWHTIWYPITGRRFQ